MNICLFAGTFNPIHNAHLKMAQFVLDNFGFDKILFIPAYKPPHKDYAPDMSNHRLKMVQIAIKNNPKFEVSDIEFKREGKSYTYLTIQELYKKYYNKEIAQQVYNDGLLTTYDKFNFIIGTDAFKKIETWYETDKLKKLVDFIVFIRENETINLDYLKEKGYNFKFAEMDFFDISSTNLRNRIKNQQPIESFVPKEVEDYIYKNGLYGN
ncbi:nicotinate (nicotinamide) nucleotide adenylyltransferase [bacterium]|nr:nicotinate (nicotinamide) nucleotide adenylyltransferase [bacterium]